MVNESESGPMNKFAHKISICHDLGIFHQVTRYHLFTSVLNVLDSFLLFLQKVSQCSTNSAWNGTARSPLTGCKSDEFIYFQTHAWLSYSAVVFIRAIFRRLICRRGHHVSFCVLDTLCPMCRTTLTPNVTHIHTIFTSKRRRFCSEAMRVRHIGWGPLQWPSSVYPVWTGDARTTTEWSTTLLIS